MASSSTGDYADTAKRLAGRGLYAVGSGLVAAGGLVARGVSAALSGGDAGDREAVRFLKFAHLEAAAGPAATAAAARLPVLLVGLDSGFQVGGAGGGRGVGSGRENASAGGGSGLGDEAGALVRRPSLPFPQVWRLDGANPAELVSRREGPVR